MAEKLLEVRKMKKYFRMDNDRLNKLQGKYLHAVDSVSFSVNEGEIFGIIGESGSGKSTIGRCILRLLDIDSGEILYRGNHIEKLRKNQLGEYRRKMQMVFQNPLSSFDPQKTIGGSFREVCKVHGIPKTESTERMNELVRYINLSEDVLDRYPKELSGGQLQRLAIARAMLVSPEFFVADEPVSALDVSVQAQILNLMIDLKKDQKQTILFISHDLTVVRHICDRVAVVYLGVIVEMGETKEVYDHVRHPYTKALISSKPKEHPLMEKEHILLRGEIPNAINVPEGCRFFNRCPKAKEGLCNLRTPKLKEVSAGHFVACHYPLKDGGK